jgi:hypothetical protein
LKLKYLNVSFVISNSKREGIAMFAPATNADSLEAQINVFITRVVMNIMRTMLKSNKPSLIVINSPSSTFFKNTAEHKYKGVSIIFLYKSGGFF